MSEPSQTVVLLVDADPMVHELVARAITSECALLGARTAEVAMRLAAKRPPAVVLIDDGVGNRAPETLYAELKVASPTVRAILLTTSKQAEHTGKLAAIGPVLAKPLDEERLLAAVRSALKLRAMSAGVERMKTGEFNAVDVRRAAPTRREGPKEGPK